MSSTTVPPSTGLSSTRVLRVFGAHPFHTDGDLLALSFAGDGTLWSVEEPGVLRRWDLDGRRQIGWHHLEELATLWAFSPDTRHVAAVSDDLAIWESATGEMAASWPQPCWVTAVAFQPNADVLAVGYDDGAVRLWDWPNQKLLHEIRPHKSAVSALAFSLDGKQLASAGEDRAIHLWETRTAQSLGSLIGHTDRIPGLVWHPDGKRLYSAGWDTTARVWDVKTCEPIILLNSHASQVHALVLSGDGSLLACADSANTIHLWDTSRNREVSVLPPQAREIRALAFNPDGRRLASGGVERVIHLWDSEKAQNEVRQSEGPTTRTYLALSPDSRRLMTLGAGAALGFWETKDSSAGPELQEAGALRAFAASPDGKWIAGSRADEDSPLVLWEAATGRRAALLEGQKDPVAALAFSGDSTLLATGGPRSSDVWLWNIPAGAPALILPCAAGDCSVEAFAFHPNKRVLAVGGVDWTAASGSEGCVALWDVDQRRQLAVFRGGASGLAFHPNGQRLAVASLVQTLRIIDLNDNVVAAEWPAHNDALTCVAYSPDGALLATGGDDHTVRLWDANTGVGHAVAELDTQVKALCFSPDGRRLYTGNGNASCYELDVAGMLAEGV